ncbi:MAG: DUF3826 domain-containing protein [Dysgonamonadaceae bacterium]|jgi:hypothetical protein|nr:DUF3826 domain-containing protein [Dysgonamonadaceae bacterium]
MKKILLFISATFFAFCNLYAQNNDAAYTKVLTDRAQKIVNTLGIEDGEAYRRVTETLVNQYKSIGFIYDSLSVDVREQKLYNLHCEFIGKLSADLSPEQIVKVKDGMTYGVVKVTYDSYCDMIPSLKEEEKRQLMAWLVEAREHAMDAPSSGKKHEWFGKYKGKFNIYLSQRGYDSKKERKAWEERLKKTNK